MGTGGAVETALQNLPLSREMNPLPFGGGSWNLPRKGEGAAYMSVYIDLKSEVPMQAETFPLTQHTWLFDLLSSGPNGRAELRTELMRRYYGALVAYAGDSGQFRFIEPHELVDEFLSSRLARPDYFERWQSSGLPLRRWLLNGLHYCGRELLKTRTRTLPLALVDSGSGAGADAAAAAAKEMGGEGFEPP